MAKMSEELADQGALDRMGREIEDILHDIVSVLILHQHQHIGCDLAHQL